MAEQRYLGGLDRLARLGRHAGPAPSGPPRTPRSSRTTLAPLLESRPIVDQVELLRAVPRPARSRSSTSAAAASARRVMIALDGLAAAYPAARSLGHRHGHRASAAIRRWLGSQTFATAPAAAASASSMRRRRALRIWTMCRSWAWWKASGPSARAATFSTRARLIAQLEPSRPERVAINEERDQVRRRARCFATCSAWRGGARALSTFALESESVVEPSSFIDDVPSFGLRTETAGRDDDASRVRYEVLIARPRRHPDRAWARCPRRVTRERDRSRFEGRGRRLGAAACQRQPARALHEVPVPVLRGERAAGRRRAGRRELALAARARPVPARAVRDVLPRMAGARPRPHHRRATWPKRARCSRRSPGRRCDRCRRPKRRSSARGCSDRRSAPASSIACSRWKRSAASRSASG